MRPNPQETADLFTFTEEILSGKPLFVQCGCSTPHGVFLRLLLIALCINPYYFSVYLYQCLILLLQNT